MKHILYFENLKLLSLSLFQKINNSGNFFKNVLRAASAILGGPPGYSFTPYTFVLQSGSLILTDFCPKLVTLCIFYIVFLAF